MHRRRRDKLVTKKMQRELRTDRRKAWASDALGRTIDTGQVGSNGASLAMKTIVSSIHRRRLSSAGVRWKEVLKSERIYPPTRVPDNEPIWLHANNNVRREKLVVRAFLAHV